MFIASTGNGAGGKWEGEGVPLAQSSKSAKTTTLEARDSWSEESGIFSDGSFGRAPTRAVQGIGAYRLGTEKRRVTVYRSTENLRADITKEKTGFVTSMRQRGA